MQNMSSDKIVTIRNLKKVFFSVTKCFSNFTQLFSPRWEFHFILIGVIFANFDRNAPESSCLAFPF